MHRQYPADNGDAFPNWKGNGFIGGMSSQSLVRIEFNGDTAREAERFDMHRRIREVEQGPDGAIWLLEDGKGRSTGWLLKLTPADGHPTADIWPHSRGERGGA